MTKYIPLLLLTVLTLMTSIPASLFADQVIGLNFAESTPYELAGKTADGSNNWIDGGLSGTGVLTGSNGLVSCEWDAEGWWHAGNSGTPDDQLYYSYFDDAGSNGPLITISGLNNWMASESYTSYIIRVYHNTNSSSGNATFAPVYVYNGTMTLRQDGDNDGIVNQYISMVTADNMWVENGSTRAYVDTDELTSGIVTVDTGWRNTYANLRANVAAIKITGINIFIANNPAPEIGEIASIPTPLTWQQAPSVAGQNITYSVYFGSNHDTYDQTPVKTTTASPSNFFFDLTDSELTANNIYYWRVDTNMPNDEIKTGSEWYFIAAPGQNSGFWESFEDFTGQSGATVHGFSGDGGSGIWSGDSKAVVIVQDDTAFSGTNYLRINDDDRNQHHITKTFSPLVPLGITKARLSFAVRRTPIEGQTVTTTGINWSIKATDAQNPGNTGSMLITRDAFSYIPSPQDNVWYTWEMNLTKGSDNKVYFTDLKITDTSSKDVVYSNSQWYTSATLTDDHNAFSWFRMFTSSSSQGYIDIDAIRLGRLPEKTVQCYRPSLPFRAFYGAGRSHHHQTLGVPGSGDSRLLQDQGISNLYWSYGTQISWNAGPQYWSDFFKNENRFWEADARYPYDYIGPGICLDEWIGGNYAEAKDWIYNGLRDGRIMEPDMFVAIWANAWGNQELYDMALDNTVDLIMTEGYTMNPNGGAGGTWSDAIREMEDCYARGIERKTILGLGHITDQENHGGGYWDENRFRYYMEYIKEEFPKSPGVAFFPDSPGDEDDYKAVLDLAGTLAKEYWPANWLPNGVYAITPQINTDCRMDAFQHGTDNDTLVKMERSNYPDNVTNQQWRFWEISDGIYRIQPAYSQEFSLTAIPSTDSGEIKVLLKQNSFQDSQKWKLIPDEFSFKLEPLSLEGKFLTVATEDQGQKFSVNNPIDSKSQMFSITPEFCELDPVVYYVQGEDGTMSGGTYYSSGGWNDRGSRGGFVNFPSNSGARVEFTNVEGFDGGEQELLIRYSLKSDTTKSMYLTINGQTRIVPVPSTGEWYNWRKLHIRCQLNPGRTNTIRLTSNSTGDIGNIDSIAIEPQPEPVIIKADFDSDQDVDIQDMEALLSQWLSPYCTEANHWCNGKDMNKSGVIDLNDWALFSSTW